MRLKFEPLRGWNWRHIFTLPIAACLVPLVLRNYELRADGKLPDQWHWADVLLLRFGYAISNDFKIGEGGAWPFRRPAVPAIAEKWVFVDADSAPWDRSYNPVTILDVREGWVRYDMGAIYRDERMRLKRFLRMYRKVS